jgi:uncharacterized protein
VKICTVIAWILLLGSLPGQTESRSQHPSTSQQTDRQQTAPAPTPSAGQSKIDPAKEADIRRLLDLTGVKALITQTMERMEKTIKPLVTGSLPPGEYREKLIDLFFVRLHSKLDAQQLLDLAVPIYDKYLSHEEIKGLIQFYETPLGQKAVDVLPKMSSELQEEGRKWGEKIGRQSILEVLSEHPDLAKALEAAAKPAQPK